LNAAFQINPKRFKGIAPQPPKLPEAAWIKVDPENRTTI